VKEEDGEKKHYTVSPEGIITLDLPADVLEVSAVFVKTRGAFNTNNLQYNAGLRDDIMAVSPATVMREFFDTFLASSSLVLLLVSALVTVVAAVGILVSIYNSVTARRKEIAILRALGATRKRVLLLICVEAALIGLFGGVLGLLAGHGMAAIGSVLLNSLLGQGIHWAIIDRTELLYLLGVVILATLAGLVPALSAYRTPVATNLVAG